MCFRFTPFDADQMLCRDTPLLLARSGRFLAGTPPAESPLACARQRARAPRAVNAVVDGQYGLICAAMRFR